MTSRFTLLGIDDEVTTCELCGKADLKCTMVLSENDADGDGVGEVRYGRDCGARALGWKVSADRAEKLVRGTARIDWWTIEKIWRATDGGCNYAGPAIGEIDGVSVKVWNRHYLGTVPAGWTKIDKAGVFAWQVAA